MNIFEKATKTKLRFETSAGNITVEDVWDLPLTGRKLSLDDLAKAVNRKVRESEEESFVTKQSAASERLKLQFDIVRHIIDVRMVERDAAKKAVEDKQKKERIKEIIASKEDQDLASKSLDELKELLKD